MSHRSMFPSVPLYRNPDLHGALADLAEHLTDRHYSAHAVAAICRHVGTTGTLAGSAIEPEDEAEATEVYIAALPEIPADSDAWDRDRAVILDVDLLARGVHPIPLVPGLAGTIPFGRSCGPVPPVAGGAPTADDFDEALARFEREHPVPRPLPVSFREPADWPDRHSPEALARIGQALYGQVEPHHA